MRIPKGMKRWSGGECAPIDWAGPKSRTMLRSGIIVQGGYRWTHCNAETPAGTTVTDIVAYTPAGADDGIA